MAYVQNRKFTEISSVIRFLLCCREIRFSIMQNGTAALHAISILCAQRISESDRLASAPPGIIGRFIIITHLPFIPGQVSPLKYGVL